MKSLSAFFRDLLAFLQLSFNHGLDFQCGFDDDLGIVSFAISIKVSVKLFAGLFLIFMLKFFITHGLKHVPVGFFELPSERVFCWISSLVVVSIKRGVHPPGQTV